MFAYETGSGVGPPINQEGTVAWIAPAAILTQIGQTVAQSVLWGISISARYKACVVALVSVLAIAALLLSLALSFVPAPGVWCASRCLTLVRSLALPAYRAPGVSGASRCLTLIRFCVLCAARAPGVLGFSRCLTLIRPLVLPVFQAVVTSVLLVLARLFGQSFSRLSRLLVPWNIPGGLSDVHDRPLNQRVLPSCDFCKFHRHISVRRMGTVTLLAILAGSVTPVLWQIGLDGVRVGEASHPGPTHLTSEGGTKSWCSCCSPRRSCSGLPGRPGPSPLCCSSPASPCIALSPQPLLHPLSSSRFPQSPLGFAGPPPPSQPLPGPPLLHPHA